MQFIFLPLCVCLCGVRVQLLSWAVVSAAGLVVVAMVTYTSFVSAATTLLGCSLGAMATVLVSLVQ